MATMVRFIATLAELQHELNNAQIKYDAAVQAAETLASDTNGKLVYMSEQGAQRTVLEVSTDIREQLLQQVMLSNVNAAVAKLRSLWEATAAMARDAIDHIDTATVQAATTSTTDTQPEPAVQPQAAQPIAPQRAAQRQPVTTAPTEAVTMTQAGAAPPRVRRI